MKKLLIVVPNLCLGGQQRVAVNMARIMGKDYDVSIVVFDSRDAVYSADCEVIDLKIPAAPGTLKKAKNALMRAAALRKIRRERKIDFCFSLGPTANLVNVLSRGWGRTIISIHAHLGCASGLINRYTFGHCDKVVCVSEQIRQTLIANCGLSTQKVATVYNPFDFGEMLRLGDEEVTDYTFSGHTIVAHGRLETQKNYPRLIRAFSLVHEQIPDTQLLIIGEGRLRPKFKALIERYGLNDCVTLPGFRANPFAYLKRCTLYVAPSYHEGFCNSLVEGICFLPAIAADCKCGPREILSNGPIDAVCDGIEEADYGILIRPSDENEGWVEEITEDDRILAEAILRFLRDPHKSEEYQNRGYKRAQEFSFERFHENVVRVLEE